MLFLYMVRYGLAATITLSSSLESIIDKYWQEHNRFPIKPRTIPFFLQTNECYYDGQGNFTYLSFLNYDRSTDWPTRYKTNIRNMRGHIRVTFPKTLLLFLWILGLSPSDKCKGCSVNPCSSYTGCSLNIVFFQRF